MIKTTRTINYSPEAQKEIEQAIVFMVKKIERHCYNKKPLMLHCLKVGLGLMELKEEKNVVIAGFLHDLIEDTDCKLTEIEKRFGKKVAKLVAVCTFDKNIKDYKKRWKKSISLIKTSGYDAMIIKLIDQMNNLPYYILISNKQKRKEVLWKHKFFINETKKHLKELKIFKDYEKLVNKFT